MTRRVPIPRYECPRCRKRLAAVKADGTLAKHDKCQTGQTPIDHGESWAPWVGRCTPAAEVPPCTRPPFPTDATENERILWLGSGWEGCHVLVLEQTRGRGRVAVLVRKGDFVAVRSCDRSPVVLTEIEDDAVRSRIADDVEWTAERKAEEAALAKIGVDWRRVGGDLRLMRVTQQTRPYQSKGAGPAYERVWAAHANLMDLILGTTFTHKGSEVNIFRLLAACSDAHLDHFRACGGESAQGAIDIAVAFRAQFRADYRQAQAFAWWRRFFVRQAWGGFERLALRPMMSYGNERRSPGRSCVRVLAEHYLHPDGPLHLERTRPLFNQPQLFETP